MSDLESDFLSTSSSSDDDLEIFLEEEKIRNENYAEVTVEAYSEETFLEHFRVSRNVAELIKEEYERSESYKHHWGQHGKILAMKQVLTFLWFIGHQTASFRDVADRFDITLSALHGIVNRLSIFISNLAPQFIKWPNETEKLQSSQHFEANGFPNIIGAIDGCHIKIDKPAEDPDSYINRKGYHSIQMQAVCNEKRKIINLFIGFPGSVHDSRVFRNSNLGKNLEEFCGNYFILGDSGYPLRNKLLTPFKDRGQLTQRQNNYNIKLSKNRYIIEHTFGILKQKFRQLYHIKLRNMSYIIHLIRAACVLHNIAIEDNFVIDRENEFLINDNIGDLDQEDEGILDDRNLAEMRNTIANILPM